MMSRDERIAIAQMVRDRERLAAAQAEILLLQRRAGTLERSLVRRVLAPARPVVRVMARAARVARRIAGLTPMAAAAVATVPSAASRGSALVIDHNWPQPDHDAGSVEIVNLMHALQALGFDTILAASEQHEGSQPARDRLMAQGIKCLQPSDAPSIMQYIAQHGPMLDLCVLCRVFCGGAFLEPVQQNCRKARLVFNSIDLNYLREERRARVTGDAGLLAVIDQLREREEHVIRSCDAIFVVSEAELTLLGETIPDSLVVQMPLARTIHPPVTPFASRHGIGFVGNFEHVPNVDAVRMFLAEIWPLVRRDLADCTLSIAGANAPADMLAGTDGSVRLLGHVPDLGPWFESLRLTVAPLRFGAGAKGKVASSLSAGVPCIVTPVAMEGMALSDEAGILVASDAAGFAAAIVQAYRSSELWNRLSQNALDYAERTLSLSAWQKRLDRALQRIGL